MAFKGKEMMKEVLKNARGKNLAPGLKESLKKCILDSKVVMGRAKCSLYAGRHIQFGNHINEDGGNKCHKLPSKPAWVRAQLFAENIHGIDANTTNCNKVQRTAWSIRYTGKRADLAGKTK